MKNMNENVCKKITNIIESKVHLLGLGDKR